MGNDGGSIPDRRDLVKSKPKAEQADKQNQTRARWFFCALSKRPLQEPIVSCALGKLYNKDALLEYLLDKSAFGDGEDICGHIRSLKDVVTLKLVPNPVRSPKDDTNVDFHPRFVCPLTQKEMNGAVPFVYISTCGCVFSAAGLKAVARNSSPKDGNASPKETGKAVEETQTEPQRQLCPQCGAKYLPSADLRSINPPEEDAQRLRHELDMARAAEAAAKPKKSKKRKAAAEGDRPGAEDEAVPKKKAKEATPTMNPSVAAASRAVVAGLQLEEAKRKASMSDAVRSLYADKNTPRPKETFMTRGTFTRYA